MNLLKYLQTLKISTLRYLQIDWRYKFQIATDMVQLMLDILAFAVLGSFIDSTVEPEELGINYDLTSFYLIGVLFWSFFQRSYEDTIDIIPEEASKGTVGFLVTNDVNLSALLISRNIASTVKTFFMALAVLGLLVFAPYFTPPSVFQAKNDFQMSMSFPSGNNSSEKVGFLRASNEIELVWVPVNASREYSLPSDNETWYNLTLLGVYTSKIYDTGPGGRYLDIGWEEETEGGGLVAVQVRSFGSKPDGENGGEAEGYVNSPNDMNDTANGTGNNETEVSWRTAENGAHVPTNPTHRYLQYRVLFFQKEAHEVNVSITVRDLQISYKDPIFALERPVFGLGMTIAVFLLVWLFMISISMGIASLNIIFKKIRPFALMLLYGMKVFSGYYFPLEALEKEVGSSISIFRALPIVNGVYLVRDVVIRGSAVSTSYLLGQLGNLLLGTVISFLASFMLYWYLERQSQKWGTLEFY